jgi:UDP-glucose:(heptosyl)LPS alpha-1,3-glucosyltransferase
MKLLFCLFKYFPFGGLQRDFLNIANACRTRGHSIHVLVSSWEGEIPADFSVSVIRVSGFTNHGRSRDFAKKVSEQISKENFDVIVGFNKLPGLDVYYAADPCFKAGVMDRRSPFYRLSLRYRTYSMLEREVFDPSLKTRIIILSRSEKEKFIRIYHTPEKRFHTLPPGISRDRISPPNAGDIRRDVRRELNISDDEFLLLMVGSSFRTKGVDRSISAMAGITAPLREKIKLFVAGEGKSRSFRRLAARLRVDKQVFFLGGRHDIPRLLLGADLLLHPAYSENTGTVLVEAMASGLPVLATDTCGYAFHVKEADAGLLIPSPFKPQTFIKLLEHMLKSPERKKWQRNGLDYTARNDVFSLPEKAADIIETTGKVKWNRK